MSENALQKSPMLATEVSMNTEPVPILDEDRDSVQEMAGSRSDATDGQLAMTKRKEEMVQDLAGWGVGLVVFGVMHLALSSFLNPAWGGVLIAIGILVLTVKSRGMFVVIGLGLWIAAFSNLTVGDFGFWTIFGFLQIYWGIKEMAKYRKYK